MQGTAPRGRILEITGLLVLALILLGCLAPLLAPVHLVLEVFTVPLLRERALYTANYSNVTAYNLVARVEGGSLVIQGAESTRIEFKVSEPLIALFQRKPVATYKTLLNNSDLLVLAKACSAQVYVEPSKLLGLEAEVRGGGATLSLNGLAANASIIIEGGGATVMVGYAEKPGTYALVIEVNGGGVTAEVKAPGRKVMVEAVVKGGAVTVERKGSALLSVAGYGEERVVEKGFNVAEAKLVVVVKVTGGGALVEIK